MRLKKSFTRVLSAAMAFMLVFMASSHESSGESESKKVYMVVANRLMIEDIEHMENLKDMIGESGVGLMNVRGASSYSNIEGFLTINSSSKSYGIQEMASMVNLNEDTKSLYETRMGILDGDYEVGNVEFNRLKLFNEDRTYKPSIGALGENLKLSGKKRAVYGNSDGEEPLRLGGLIAMDQRGLVDYGDVENVNMEDKLAPFGVRIDYGKVLGNIEKLKDEVDFTVVDIGDLDRLKEYEIYLDEEMFMHHRLKALEQLDGFIRDLKESVGKDSMIVVISPNEGGTMETERKLSPLVIWTDDMEPSLLTSGSTRVEGLVTNMDIAPTVSEYLSAPQDNYVGRSISYESTGREADTRLEYLLEMSTQSNFTLEARGPMLSYYAVMSMVVMVIACVFVVASGNSFLKEKSFVSGNRGFWKKGKQISYEMIVFVASAPLSFMLAALLKLDNLALLAIASILTSGAITILTRAVRNRLPVIFSLTAALIVLDVALGSYLARNSVMGYSPVIGARYFGIGNELSGLLLSAVMITTGLLMQKSGKKFYAFIPFAGLLVMGLSKLGANVGGSIAFATAAIMLVLLSGKRKLKLKSLVAVGAIIAAGIAAAGIADASLSESPTHLGKLFLSIKAEGVSSLLEVVVRKLSMNISLLSGSVWSRVLMVTTVVSGVAVLSLKDIYRERFQKHSYMLNSVLALIAGSLVGLLVNDSGVLLAAFANIYTASFLLQAGMNEKEKES